MKSLAFVLSILAVMGLAFWAYGENYKTQRALSEVQNLQRQIGALRETRTVLKAEWAYLNRPDRLRDLANLNFERLELVPLAPAQFGRVEQVAFPRSEPLFELIEDPVNVAALLPPAEEPQP
ncbi:cell division protein FtsL [Pseudoruegeria sp. HB172150]|uniref:cell division protein FtsL n=1 Tax=Pseudoruegeria sp. HB172150 TaxID=2721164 RepID=UPI001551F04B|nr:cell division protein FtsL [Pseudoruegeria sp. HB172150]